MAGLIAGLNGDIVDEPRRAEPCRGQKPDRALAARGDGAKGFGMTGFEIIRDETRRGNGAPGSIESGFDGNSRIDVAGTAAKRRIQRRRKRAFFRR